jgi:hypothetical protein
MCGDIPLKIAPKIGHFVPSMPAPVLFLTCQVNELNKKPIQSKEEVLAGDF